MYLTTKRKVYIGCCRPIVATKKVASRKLGEYTMTLITLNDLSKAISNRIGINMHNARRDAGFVMDIFGFGDRVIDNVLDPEDRQLFYILEEEGMLTTEREETTLYDGREWRTHYWRLRKDVISRYADTDTDGPGNLIEEKQTRHVDDEFDYGTIDENAWGARKFDDDFFN